MLPYNQPGYVRILLRRFEGRRGINVAVCLQNGHHIQIFNTYLCNLHVGSCGSHSKPLSAVNICFKFFQVFFLLDARYENLSAEMKVT